MFYKIFADDWDEIKSISSISSHFVFRGHAQKDWKLKPTLERAADKYLVEYSNLFSHEYMIYREFKSVANHYLIKIPEEKNYLEWMTILQHYGAPTRLLDFSDSLYIASFFAFEFALEDCAIWALNDYKLNDPLISKWPKDRNWKMEHLLLQDFKIEVANKLFDYENKENINQARSKYLDNKNTIFSVKPDNRNERLAIQKGVFLMSSNLEESFENILMNKFNIESLSEDKAEEISISDLSDPSLIRSIGVFKIIINKKVCIQGLKDLRNMNIDAATLFPGLDGQARSLNYIMRKMELSSKRSND